MGDFKVGAPSQALPGPIRITCVQDLEALGLRRQEWNRLVERSHTNTVFQTFEWQTCWWKAFGGDAQLLLLLAEAGGELVAIAPLMLSHKRIWGRSRRVIEFIGGSACDYGDFIVDSAQPEVWSLMLHWLAENERSWDLLSLANIADTSPLLHLLPDFFRHCAYPLHLQALNECPTYIFADPAADQLLVKKKSLKRHFNYFRRHGQLEFKQCDSPEEILEYLDVFFEQHIRRWALSGCPSQFLQERERNFYRELVQAFAPTGWLLFSVLLFDQTPIAFHFGFEYANRIFYIKPTFDIDHFTHSPGEVLLKYLLEDALERRMAEFDFTVGGEAYKYRFANHVRLSYVAEVYRHALPYHADRLLLATGELIKQSSFMHRLGRHILGRPGNLSC
jgi:CelD/BcsL family acetyltransferase involved in cellulose biosynthesis